MYAVYSYTPQNLLYLFIEAPILTPRSFAAKQSHAGFLFEVRLRRCRDDVHVLQGPKSLVYVILHYHRYCNYGPVLPFIQAGIESVE